MAASSTECKICLDRFDTEHKRPRTLPCGHCFCSHCLHDLLKDGSLTCPACRKEHAMPKSEEFPINYLVEDLMKEMKISPHAPMKEISSNDPEQSIAVSESICHGGTLNKKVASMRDEQVKSLQDLNESVKAIMSDIAAYKQMLMNLDLEHDELISRVIETLVNQNKETQQRLKKDQVILEDLLCEGQEKQQLLQSAVESLGVASTTQDVVTAIDSSDHYQVHMEDWVQRSKESLSCNSVTQSVKVRSSTRQALDIMDCDLSDDKIGTLFEEVKNYSIEKKVQIIMELATAQVTVQSLCKHDEAVDLLLERELIYAVHEDEVRGLRFAKITQENGYIYLHHLTSNPPPKHTHILKYDEVAGLQDPNSTLTFLELVWPNSPAFKVHIRLSPKTLRGDQFAMLCKGVFGTTHANTRLLEMGTRFNKGKPGEHIEAGDYDQTGGAAIIANLSQDGEYKTPIEEGSVCGYGSRDLKKNEQYGSRFCIVTKVLPGHGYRGPFGHVEKGLEEIQVENALDGTISDCGLVIPMNNDFCSTSSASSQVDN